ncbi:MAG: hypothetical protein Q9157_006737 [Trypethelium eluteriae]
MALPATSIDVFATDEDYQRLQTILGINKDMVKSTLKMYQRLSHFGVFDGYSESELNTVFDVLRDPAARQLFSRTRQAANDGTDQAVATAYRDSGFYSNTSNRTSYATPSDPSRPGLSTAKKLAGSDSNQDVGHNLYESESLGAASYSSDGHDLRSYFNRRSTETHSIPQANATAIGPSHREIDYYPRNLSPRRAAFSPNLMRLSSASAQTAKRGNVNDRISATASAASQAAPDSAMTRSTVDSFSQVQSGATTRDERLARVPRTLYECTHCGGSSWQAGYRNRHHAEKHDALYKYECPQCPSNAKHYDSYKSIRMHLSGTHGDQSSPEYNYPTRRQYRSPNLAMACGICGSLFRRREWNATATSADRTRRASRGTGLPRTPKAIAFQQDQEEDERNQAFISEVWYNHIANEHDNDFSSWSRRVIAVAFLNQEELKPYFEFATLEDPQHWNSILEQRVEDDRHWATIHEHLEFYALSGKEEDAKTTIELCLGLAAINWTPFQSANSQRTLARNSLTPHENMINLESAVEVNKNLNHSMLAQQEAASLRVPHEAIFHSLNPTRPRTYPPPTQRIVSATRSDKEKIASFPLPPTSSRHTSLPLVSDELSKELQSHSSSYNSDEANGMSVDEEIDIDEIFSAVLYP